MRTPPALLVDISRNIDLVQDFIKARTQRHFEHDIALRYAVSYAMLIIVDAVCQLPEALRAREPDVPWNMFVSLAEYQAHHRHNPDAGLIWATATAHLAPLQAAVKRLLAEEREFANID